MAQKRTGKSKRSTLDRPRRSRGRTSGESRDEDHGFPIVGVGASAGGLEAFIALFEALPADTGMGFVLVPHLAPTHESALVEILSRTTSMPIQEVTDEPVVEPNRIYVLPPGREMVIERGRLHLRPREPKTLQRAVDRFLRSLAEDQKHHAIGVILSGTASDGTVGLSAIKAEGGITFAQDDTAQQTGMPHSAIAEGSVDFVLPPHEIAQELVRIARHPPLPASNPDGTDAGGVGDIRNVLYVVRRATGVDFTQYKPTTLQRRIQRRMMVRKTPSLAEYAELLRTTPAEVGALHHDLLIGVTTFFRNPEAFERLKSRIFPTFVARDRTKDPVRMWVLGCSTGQEAYSLAIALTEFLETLDHHVPVQIFASDLNAAAIEIARSGTYARDIVHDVSPERLRRFFAHVDGQYRIVKSIREMCVFSQHNVLVDPPFSRLDLISCRNLLMYLEPALQQQVIPTLYYALKPSGALWLGSAESVGPQSDLFQTEDARHKIFTKIPGGGRQVPSQFSLARPSSREVPPPRRFDRREGPDLSKEGERVLLARFAPAGVLVSPTMEIVQYRGDVGPYLSPAQGKASLGLLKMVASGLQVAVRAGIQRAKKEETTTHEDAVDIAFPDGSSRRVSVEVIPVRGGGGGFWVLFHDPDGERPTPRRIKPRAKRGTAGDMSEQIAHLSRELSDTREYLQSVIEQQEASHEALQAANEEVQSANEELQSINEELETSKEEIQSSNEELSTVNDELQHRNSELNRTNNDLVNFLASTHQGIVFVARDLRIRRYTPFAESLLNLIPSDVGRHIRDVRLAMAVPNLEAILTTVIETLEASEQQVRDEQGRWFSLRVRPYRTLDNQIDGAVLIYVDVDAVTRARMYAESIIATVREPLVVLDLDGFVMTANAAFYSAFGGDPARNEGARFTDLDDGVWDIPELRQFLQDVAPLGHTFNFELTRDFGALGRKVLLLTARRLVQVPDDPAPVLLAIEDVTELRHAEGVRRQRVAELAAADKSKNEFLAMLAHELRNPLAPIRSAVQILGLPGVPAATSEKARIVIDRQVRTMTRLIEDLLDVARITQGKISLRKTAIDVNTVLQRAVELVQPLVDQRRQTLSVAVPVTPCYVMGDATRLEQAFGNLLHNASKFTGPSGHIWLRAEGLEAHGRPSEVVVRLRDDGMGIPADVLPVVFDLFKQGSASPHHAAGLGVGLALVYRIVTLHGGRVTVESAGVNQGCEFTVALPAIDHVEQVTESNETDKVPADDEAIGRRVLVVDDNEDAADSLAELLRLRGHQVRVVHDGAAALAAVGSFLPHIIFMDIAMPDMDGYEVARQLRARPELDHPFIVAVTGFGGDGARHRAQDAGFDEHATKPLDPATLTRLLTRRRVS